MDIHYIFITLFESHLADCFHKRQGFNITNSSADFRHDYIRFVFQTIKTADTLLDFFSYMRNNLYSCT